MEESAIHLVQKNEHDEPFLFSLYCSVRADELSQWPMAEEQKLAFLHMQYTMQKQQYDVHYSNSDYYIIYHDEQQIGRLIVDRGAEAWRIVDISLLSSHQNLGFGSQLIQELLLEAKQHNKAVSLSVLRTNPAARLYERLGFRKQAEDEVYMTMLSS